MGLECGYAGLSEGWESRNVGRIVQRTAERLLVGSEETSRSEKGENVKERGDRGRMEARGR